MTDDKTIMKKTELDIETPVLDDLLCQHLGEAIKPENLSAQRKNAIRQRILNQIENEPAAEQNLLFTLHQNEGNWIQIAPKLMKKQLNVDLEKGTESYLLKAEPGAEIPAHHHEHDEIAIILEGSVHFEDLQLNVGDYHVARKGSTHTHVTCPVGALVYLQAGLAEQPPL